MKLHSFYLFYFLTAFVLFAGYKNSQAQVIGPELSYGDTAIIRERLWPYFISMSLAALLTGLTYHYWLKRGRRVRTSLIIFHFISSVLGVFLSFNVYRVFIILKNSGAPDLSAVAFGNNTFLVTLLGPIFLIVSLVLFITALTRAKRTQT